MKLNKWHIDLMRDAFGVELTPDDHGQMVSVLAELSPVATEVVVTKNRIVFEYDEASAKSFEEWLELEQAQLEQAH